MSSPLTLEQVAQALDQMSLLKRNKRLTDGERTVLGAVWDGLKYEEAARRSGHDPRYLESVASYELRSFITKALGNGKSIHKRQLRNFLEEHSAVLQHLLEVPPGEQSPSKVSVLSRLEIIGGHPPEVPEFYGRHQELYELQQKIQRKNCVAVVGPPGVGKSALTFKLIQQLATEPEPQFDCVVWKSIFYAPSLEELLAEINPLLANFLQLDVREAKSPTEQISELFGYLRKSRILLVLDSVEAILQGNPKSFSPYGKQYASYGNFFRRLIAEQLSSRLLLLSRRPLMDVMRLSFSGESAYVVQLAGLDEVEAQELLRNTQLLDEHRWADLIKLYRGNPYLLWEASRKTRELFGRNVEQFLLHSIAEDPHFLEALDEQIGPASSSSAQEKWALIQLAHQIEQGIDPVPFSLLLETVHNSTSEFPGSSADLTVTIALLCQAGLIEKVEEDENLQLSLPPLMKKYIALRQI